MYETLDLHSHSLPNTGRYSGRTAWTGEGLRGKGREDRLPLLQASLPLSICMYIYIRIDVDAFIHICKLYILYILYIRIYICTVRIRMHACIYGLWTQAFQEAPMLLGFWASQQDKMDAKTAIPSTGRVLEPASLPWHQMRTKLA